MQQAGIIYPYKKLGLYLTFSVPMNFAWFIVLTLLLRASDYKFQNQQVVIFIKYNVSQKVFFYPASYKNFLYQ